MGDSLVEPDSIAVAKSLLEEGKGKLVLPIDCVIADAFSADAKRKTVSADKVKPGWRVLDIGPKTVALFGTKIKAPRCGLERADGRF